MEQKYVWVFQFESIIHVLPTFYVHVVVSPFDDSKDSLLFVLQYSPNKNGLGAVSCINEHKLMGKLEQES